MDMSKILIKLARGTDEQHKTYNIRRGNITIVTDKPELRYHDGCTQGGVAIPIDSEIHAKILESYKPLKESWLQKLTNFNRE